MSEMPRINREIECETCGWRRQPGFFQRTRDTEKRGIALEPDDAHDGSDKVVLANSRQTEFVASEGCQLKFLHTNAQSQFPKLDELRTQVAVLSPNIIAITEKWLSQNSSDCEVALSGYQLFRSDRIHCQDGRVTMFSKSEKITNGIEAIWLTIWTWGSQFPEVMTLYRPPGIDFDGDTFLLKTIKEIGSRPDVG
ncbi:unnamed protein product [Schistocephalus solidus]|uniref:Reverse transcriptase n=1 Tax=Schistocephalus solidus TaxID=70667 RepID=A0A183SU41_SCHSO|nr:unnamed protein product [Schistocephalus solidus]